MGTGVQGGSGNGNSRAKREWEREWQRDLWLGMRGNGNDSMGMGGMGTARVIPAHIPTWRPIPSNECSSVCNKHGTRSLRQWVIWVIFHVRVTGSPGHHFDPVWDTSFFRFSKKCPKCKTYIWNAEMTKVIVRCLLLDWNHWMSVHAMNLYFYLWLLKILCTPLHISRHLGFII